MDGNHPEDDDMFEEDINEDDILEVIELDDLPNGEGDELAEEMDDIHLEEGVDAAMVGEAAASDDAEVVFDLHNGSVFCASTSPDSLLAVTGGEDDLAYVWTLADGQVRFKCEGHKDSVVAAAFNRTGRYVATADMAGLVQVWSTDDGKMVWSAESSDIEWLMWHQLTDAVLVGTADGAVWMWRVPSGECKIYQGPDCACACGKITPDGKQLIAGYGDGSIRVWDLRDVTVVYSTSAQESHTGPVTSLDIHPENPLVVTSSVDSCSKLININTKKVVHTINLEPPNNSSRGGRVPDSGDHADDDADDSGDENQDGGDDSGLECARFCPTFPYVAVCGLDGRLTVWDMGSSSVRCTCQHASGVVSCVWDAAQPVLYTCTLDGLVHEWDARTGVKTRQFSGHQAQILSIEITKDGEKLLSTSDDGTARVFPLTSPDR